MSKHAGHLSHMSSMSDAGALACSSEVGLNMSIGLEPRQRRVELMRALVLFGLAADFSL